LAYDETLAHRIRTALAGDSGISEKKMFGGLAFLDRGLMFVGVSGRKLMARVGKENYADSLRREHVREMDFTGKPIQGYVYVEPPASRPKSNSSSGSGAVKGLSVRCQPRLQREPAQPK
jgi:hypothetical protein